jgi:hypothetical protein
MRCMKDLLLALLAIPTAAMGAELPQLPVRASFSGDGPICASSDMRQYLDSRFWRIVGPGDSSDLQIECTETSGGIALKVHAPGKGAKFTVERTPSSTPREMAYLAVKAAADDAEIGAAALGAYLARNAQWAALGSDNFAAADWVNAARYLSVGLESELNLSPLYFGLYRAHAELSHSIRAKWYLEAYLRAADLSPSVLTKEQALPLIKAEASSAEDVGDADAAFAEYQALASAQRWDAALQKLHDIVEIAPWYEPAYVSLAESYNRIGWKRLAKLWKARAVFVHRLNKDARLGKNVEARLDELAAH